MPCAGGYVYGDVACKELNIHLKPLRRFLPATIQRKGKLTIKQISAIWSWTLRESGLHSCFKNDIFSIYEHH